MTNHETRHPRMQRSGDRGVVVLFFAISVTAMLAVAALVLGGSVGYTAVRNAQTAADSAALAGSSTIQDHKRDWVATPAEDVLDTVRSVVEGNGAILEPGGCDLVAAEYAISGADIDVIADCSLLGTLPESDFADVAGVRVTVGDTRDVPFGAFVEEQTITGKAVAAATIQPVSEGRAPFMVCTAATATGHPAQALIPDPSDATGYSINTDAIGKEYVLHGNQIKETGKGRDCGNPSSDWRGLVGFGTTFPVPSASPDNDLDWWTVETGNTTGNLPRSLTGSAGCRLGDQSVDSLAVGCMIAAPLCPKGNGASSGFRLYCVKMAAFEITYNSSLSNPGPPQCHSTTTSIICGRFLGAAVATGGQGRAVTADPNGVAVIKLVQ